MNVILKYHTRVYFRAEMHLEIIWSNLILSKLSPKEAKKGK